MLRGPREDAFEGMTTLSPAGEDLPIPARPTSRSRTPESSGGETPRGLTTQDS
jgi:hypothetical protein